MNNKYSQELYKGQRTKEKRALWGRFLLGVVVKVYKRHFFELFENRCFKCGAPELPSRQGEFQVLCVDHHIPMVLGGRLVPGNLGCLCRTCNSKKKGAPPDVFYSPVELAALELLLQQQQKLFDFRFDHDSYDQDRVAYLVRLGVDPVEAAAAAHDPDHPDYIVPVGDSVSITLSVDIDELMCQTRGLDK